MPNTTDAHLGALSEVAPCFLDLNCEPKSALLATGSSILTVVFPDRLLQFRMASVLDMSGLNPTRLELEFC